MDPTDHSGTRAFVPRKAEAYGDGFVDGLEPLRSLDLDQCKSVDDLVRQMGNTAFTGRALGEAADVYEAMVRDPDCYVVATLSGAMTVAKMGLLLCRMIDQGMVQAVVSTGALMAHGFVESIGLTHFKYDPSMDDAALYHKGYNRVYDSLELEKNLDDTVAFVREALDGWPVTDMLCSFKLNHELGRLLDRRNLGPGILRSAYRRNIPVYVPAFTDSELGLDFLYVNEWRRQEGMEPLHFDAFDDLRDLCKRFMEEDRLGIFTIGGGVPRNWTQQIPPLIDGLAQRCGWQGEIKRIRYGVRLCPEPVHWGGLSGCTYREGISWGKFVPPHAGGQFAEVLSDATLAWPILQMAVEERLRKDPPAHLDLYP